MLAVAALLVISVRKEMMMVRMMSMSHGCTDDNTASRKPIHSDKPDFWDGSKRC